MEHAIWTKSDLDTRYVSIKDIKRDLGEDKARREVYRCPSENCGVKMITVFPKKKRLGAKEVHSDHFRAKKGARHREACTGDGARDSDSTSSTGIETGAKPRHEVVGQSSYPNRYTRRYRAFRDGTNKGTRGDDGRPDTDETIDLDERDIGRTIHTSEPETGHIRTIVEAHENATEDLSQMKLRLPESRARNYAEAFRQVANAVDENGRVAGHYIYHGPYLEHRVYANDAISITFAILSGNDKKLGVWIKPEVAYPRVYREKVKEYLASASLARRAILYVFGRFQLFRDWKYSIEVEALGDFWITFPSNIGLS